MLPTDSNFDPPAQPVRHHVLEAEDAVIHVPSDRYIRCLEADLAHADDRIAKLTRKAKPMRKPSLVTHIKAVRRAGAEAEIKPDGTVFTRDKCNTEGEQANGHANTWDDIL
jgi:hypothetical protein